MTVSSPLGWLLRRAVMVPLMLALAVLLVPVWLLTAALSLVLLVAVPLVTRRAPRLRPLRLVTLALAYATGECACVLVCFLLWLGSGAGLAPRGRRWVRLHQRLLRLLLGALLGLAGRLLGFRVVVEEPARPDDLSKPTPLVVLARHAGPGASFVLAHVLMAHYRRRPHVVLKDALRLDPAIDLLLTRMGCTWVPPRSRRTSSSAEAIRAAAAGLEPDQALLLFPEGADWTPVRHLAAVTRLRRRGLLREARLALRMPHVLPPHPAGAAAALRGAPTADVLVFTHTGHDELLDASAAWRSLPLRDPLRMAWWRPSTRPGATADDEQVLAWLREIWQEIEHWVSEQQHLAALTGEAGAVGAQPTSSG